RFVEVAEDLQLGVGDRHVHRGGADVHAEEAQRRREPDGARPPPAAGGGETVRDGEPGLQQPVDLGGQGGPGELETVRQRGPGPGAVVTYQPEQARLVRVRRTSRHTPHATLPPPKRRLFSATVAPADKNRNNFDSSRPTSVHDRTKFRRWSSEATSTAAARTTT